MTQTKLTTVKQRFDTVWTDFNIYNQTRYTEFLLDDDGEIKVDSNGNQIRNSLLEMSLTDDVISIILNFSRYTGYDKKAYGISVNIERGITEQESYDYWLVEIQRKNSLYKEQLLKLGLKSLSQCVYDGLFLYYWFTEKLLEVQALEGIYDMRKHVIDKNWDIVASMMMRCDTHKEQAIEAAKILRLSFYKRYKDRRWLRQQGVFKMRDKNELYKFNTFTQEELDRARFAYYAETKKFLPYTPEGIKRDINNRYADTLAISIYTWDGTTTQYEILKSPSLYPIEKLQVYVNNDLIQHFYDYTIDGTIVTLKNTENYLENSKIKFVISI